MRPLISSKPSFQKNKLKRQNTHVDAENVIQHQYWLHLTSIATNVNDMNAFERLQITAIQVVKNELESCCQNTRAKDASMNLKAHLQY